MRIEADLDHELRARVKSYAEEQGLRLPRAYREVIDSGLEAEGY